MNRVGPLRSAARGFGLLFEGLGMLRQTRPLWGPASAPIALSLAAFTLAVALILQYAGPLHDAVSLRLPLLEASSWVAWLWIGPAKLAIAVFSLLLVAAASAAALLVALLAAGVAASPFLDLLSRRVEEIALGSLAEGGEVGLAAVIRDACQALVAELRRVCFFALIGLSLVTLGIVVPGGQLVAPPALLIATLLFLPLDYSGYALDRRRLTFRARRAWIVSNLATMTGFGAAAFVTLLVPGLNLLMLPALVVAGTLLVLRTPPPDQPPSPS